MHGKRLFHVKADLEVQVHAWILSRQIKYWWGDRGTCNYFGRMLPLSFLFGLKIKWYSENSMKSPAGNKIFCILTTMSPSRRLLNKENYHVDMLRDTVVYLFQRTVERAAWVALAQCIIQECSKAWKIWRSMQRDIIYLLPWGGKYRFPRANTFRLSQNILHTCAVTRSLWTTTE